MLLKGIVGDISKENKKYLETIFTEIQYTLRERVWIKISDHIWCTNFLLAIIIIILLCKL